VTVGLTNDQWLNSGYGADPDAVVSLAAWVGRDWSHGVRIVRVSGLVNRGAVGECRHSDGSRWFVAMSQYCVARATGGTAQECVDNLRSLLDANELARVRAIVADDDIDIDYAVDYTLGGAP